MEMKAKPSIAFNQFSGTAKDVTARINKGRQVLSTRAKQSSQTSPSQALRRSSFAKISRAYKSLSDLQMKGWSELGERLKSQSTLGIKISLTAHNTFVKLNTNRLLVGETLLLEAPKESPSLPVVTFQDFWLRPDKILFTGLNHVSDSLRLVMKMSRSESTGVSSAYGDTVVISPGIISDWGDADVTKDYIDTIGLPPIAGQKYFIELYWLDSKSGFTGEHTLTSAICEEEYSALQKAPLIERKRLTLDDVSPRDPKDSVSKFEYEVAEKGNFGAIDTVFELGTYVAGTQLKATFRDDMPSYMRQFVFGRGYRRPTDAPDRSCQYEICDMEIHYTKENSGYNIQLARRGGSPADAIEIFSVTPFISVTVISGGGSSVTY